MQNTYMIIIDYDDKISVCLTPDFVMKFTMTVMYIVSWSKNIGSA